MSSRDPSVMPKPLGGIEFGRIGGQLMHLQPMSVLAEPAPNISIFMIRGIILYKVGTTGSGFPTGASEAIKKAQIGGGVEDIVFSINELGLP